MFLQFMDKAEGWMDEPSGPAPLYDGNELNLDDHQADFLRSFRDFVNAAELARVNYFRCQLIADGIRFNQQNLEDK